MPDPSDTPKPSVTPPTNLIRRRLVTAAPSPNTKVQFRSPATEKGEIPKPRFLTPELKAQLEKEQEEQARIAAEQEAARIAAEQEAARIAAEQEAARIAAEQEAARLAAEQEAARIAAEQEAARIAAEQEAARLAAEQEAARIAAEQEAARIAAEQEAARLAAEQEAARIAAEQEAARLAAEEQEKAQQAAEEQRLAAERASASQHAESPANDVNAQLAQLQDALAKVAAAQQALAEAQVAAMNMNHGTPDPTSSGVYQTSQAPTTRSVFKTSATPQDAAGQVPTPTFQTSQPATTRAVFKTGAAPTEKGHAPTGVFQTAQTPLTTRGVKPGTPSHATPPGHVSTAMFHTSQAPTTRAAAKPEVTTPGQNPAGVFQTTQPPTTRAAFKTAAPPTEKGVAPTGRFQTTQAPTTRMAFKSPVTTKADEAPQIPIPSLPRPSLAPAPSENPEEGNILGQETFRGGNTELNSIPSITSEDVQKSKNILQMSLYICGGLAAVIAGVGIYYFMTKSDKDQAESDNARLTELVTIGSKLGSEKLYDSKNLKRVKGVTITPNAEDATLLLSNIRGVKNKGNKANWPGAAHLVSIMAQLDDSIAKQVVGDMKKNSKAYTKDQFAMMITLLAKSSSPKMRELLKDLYESLAANASTGTKKDKGMQDKQAVVLKGMRFSLKPQDLDDVIKLLANKDSSGDLTTAAYTTARYIIDKENENNRPALSQKLLALQKDIPEENMQYFFKLLSRTGDNNVLDMMENIYKEDAAKGRTVVKAWADWNSDDVIPYLLRVWKGESIPANAPEHGKERLGSEAHDSILRVLAVDRDRDEAKILELYEPLIADADTPQRRRYLASSFRSLSYKPYVDKIMARIKKDAQAKVDELEKNRNKVDDESMAAEEKAKANPGDAAAQADAKNKQEAAMKLSKDITEWNNVVADVDKILEKIKKNPTSSKKNKKGAADEEDDDGASAIKS